MLIFDRENWPKHRAWAVFTAVATAAAVAWYVVYGFASGTWRWPGGSSPPGLTFGMVGGSIIVFEMLLWPRKSLWRGLRLGRTKTWMMAHIWLGSLAFPLLLLHGRFHFALESSTLAAVLTWLLAAVTLSGFWGLFMQQVLPRVLLERVPAETIHCQIDHILEQYREEAAQLVRLTCGSAGAAAKAESRKLAESEPPAFLVVGSVRKVGLVEGKVVQAGVKAAWVPESEALRTFYEHHVDPYFRERTGRGRDSPLNSAPRAAGLFQQLKTQLRTEAHPTVDRIAALCDQRRQFDVQIRLHRWLHLWLAIHVPLSVALLGLMVAHAFMALKYI